MSSHVKPCNVEACAACPWRVSNFGKPSPKVNGQKYGWYTLGNLRRLWSGIRTGGMMTCHPTDHQQSQVNGKLVSEDIQTVECAGATIIQQRELQILSDMIDNGWSLSDYRRQRSLGLTKDAALVLVQRVMFPGGNPLAGLLPLGRPNLNDVDIQFVPLGLWESRPAANGPGTTPGSAQNAPPAIGQGEPEPATGRGLEPAS